MVPLKIRFPGFPKSQMGWTKRSSIVDHHIDDRANCVLHILIALSLALFWTTIFENVALKMEFQELHISVVAVVVDAVYFKASTT